jgi:uncharacterized protein YceK
MTRIQFVSFGIILLLTVALVLAGCATIFKGTDQEIKINSTPSQAKLVIKTSGGVVTWEGATPATVKLARKNEYIVTVSLQGYKDRDVNITHASIEGWFWGNLLCGGVIGIIVDATNGAMHRLGPDDISVALTTAQLDDGRTVIYAVFHAMDSSGQLRSLAVPLEGKSAGSNIAQGK